MPNAPATLCDGLNIGSQRCPVETTLRVIGGKWKALVLYHLRTDIRRFNELRRLVPDVTQRMLTQHLRELEADGVVSRTVHPVVPPHVDYALTNLGRTLLPILDAMAEWGADHEARCEGAPLFEGAVSKAAKLKKSE